LGFRGNRGGEGEQKLTAFQDNRLQYTGIPFWRSR